MKLKLPYLLVSVLIWLAIFHAVRNDLALPADFRPTSHSESSWFPLINLTSNSFHLWRDPPLIGIFAGSHAQRGMPGLLPCIVIFLAGCAILFRRNSFIEALTVASALSVALLLLFGRDSVIFGSLAWLPWVTLAMRTGSRNPLAAVGTLVVFSLAFALGANQFGLLLFPCAVLALEPKKRAFGLLVFGFFILLTYQCTIPPSSIPEYPALSHVVPDDGISGILRPLVTMDAPIPLIDRFALRQALQPALLTVLAGVLVLLISLRGKDERRTFYPVIGLLLIVILDLLPAESLAQIAPLSTIERVFPNLRGIALAPMALAATLFLVTAYALRVNRGPLFIGLTMAASIVWYANSRSSNRYGIAVSTERVAVGRASIDPVFDSVLISPSLRVIAEYGDWSIDAESKIAAFQSVSLKDSDATVHGSDRAEMIARLMDGKPRSRWSPKKGKQEGNEWLEFTFPNPFQISGIELSPGEYSTDFPRALRIRAGQGTDCANAPVVFETNSWQGALRYTKSGFPFFAGQDQVQIYFKNQIELQCIKVEQTGRAPFDWSVSEVRFFR